MIKYIIKRILMMIPVLLGVTLLVFTMMHFSPGNPEDFILGDMATEEDKELFREENGLNDPFIVQYGNYIKKIVLEGDLGTSYTTKRSVTEEIVERFPTTIKFAATSMLLAVVVGVITGIISAVKQNSIWDNISRIIAIIGVSMPNFWLGLMLILFFSVKLGILPSAGFTSWKHWILPAITIGMETAATIMRMTRSSMLDSIRQDYIRTARAKGQSEKIVIWKHALGNAIIPVLTVIGVNFGKMMGGAAVTEMVFSIPGLGKLIVDSIKVKNTPMVQGGIIFIAVAMSICNLLVDILYAYVDPRIRSQYMKPRKTKRFAKEVPAVESDHK